MDFCHGEDTVVRVAGNGTVTDNFGSDARADVYIVGYLNFVPRGIYLLNYALYERVRRVLRELFRASAEFSRNVIGLIRGAMQVDHKEK